MSPAEPPPFPMDDYYAILEVSPEATEEAIRSSYRRLARLRHPDKNPSDPNATAHFQVLQTAYSILVDSESREAYDSSRNSSQEDPYHSPGRGSYDDAAPGSWHAAPPPNPVNLSSMSEDAQSRHARKRIAELERNERSIKDDIMHATEAMLAAKLSFRKCQESMSTLNDVATDYYLPSSSRHRHGSVFVNILSGPKRDLYLARQHELDRWQSKVDKLCDKVWSLHNRFDAISELRGEYIRMYGGDGPDSVARRMQREREERDEREREEMKRRRDRDRRERERDAEQDKEWRDIRDRERDLQDRLGRMMAGRKAREEQAQQAQRDLDARNERIRRETEKKVEQWEWEAIERQLKKDQQHKDKEQHHHKEKDKDSHKTAERGRARDPKPVSESVRQEREKAKAKDRKKRVEEELAKFAEAEAKREADDQDRGEREYRERQQRATDQAEQQQERTREDKTREDKVKEDEMREDKAREDRTREDKAREERAQEAREREENERLDREREQESQRQREQQREMEEKEREWARREYERREFERREVERREQLRKDQEFRAHELEREHERLREQKMRDTQHTSSERVFRDRLRPEEEVIMVYTDAEPPRKSRRHNHHHSSHLHSGSDRGSDRGSRSDRYADRIDRERRMHHHHDLPDDRARRPDKSSRRCRHVGVWARVRGNVSCMGCRRGSNSAVVLVCPGCPKMMCRECLVEGQRATSVRMRDSEGDEYSIRSWHSR